MDDRNNQKCLNAAEQVLSKHFRSDMYSFDGIVDCAVCLIKSESGWDVYLKEKNATSNLVTHMNVMDAIIDMINRIAGREAEQVRAEFYALILQKDIA